MEMPDPALLQEGENPVVLVFQDESTYPSNDGRHFYWVNEKFNPIQLTSDGTGIMYPDFITGQGRPQVPEGTDSTLIPKYGIQIPHDEKGKNLQSQPLRLDIN